MNLKISSFLGKTEAKQDKPEKSLHPMLLMCIVVMLCAVFSYIIPAGEYTRVMDESIGAELIDPDSFTYIERTPTTLMGLLESLTLGLQNASYIIFFLFIIGGMFSILNGTGALNVAVANMLKKLKGHEILLIPILMVFFGSGAAFLGNFEEFLAFVPLILAICITTGYDSLTAVGIIFMAATAGYGGAVTNAFTVGIAQQIAGLPAYSGQGIRLILLGILEAASIAYVMIYARLVKKTPKISEAYSYDQKYNKGKKIDLDNIPVFSARQMLALIIFIAGIGFSVWGVIVKGYYIDELSAVFLATGILAGIAGGLRPGEICERFIKGCQDMLFPGIMIGLANAAIHILEEANVMDTILHGLDGLIGDAPHALMACAMFIAHEILNVIVPSGSAQAKLTMPLMIPLADQVGLSRQVAVIAYQLGDAFTNILSPTGGEILAALAICRVPFSKWVRFLLPLFLIWWLIALLFLVFITQMGI
ncbi:MAG: AbgT family transporter [Lachnospiraceae bacterium]|nr:AbgT family transporter [Lachnospiraceae bacterium]